MKWSARIAVLLAAVLFCAVLLVACSQSQEPVRNFIIPDNSGEAAPTAAVVEPTPTPSATVAPSTEATQYETLKLEMESDAVKAMQQRLQELGYLDADSVTGYFGSKTEAAVKKFQETNGLDADGIAGQGTLTVLMGADAKAAG